MKMFKKGDIVEVLDDAIIGQVTAVKNDTIFLISEDGFELNFKTNEVIKRIKPLDSNSFFDYASLNEVIKEKSEVKRKNITVSSKKERYEPTMEVDLHIHNLVDNERHLTAHDKKTIQLDTAKHKLEFAMKKNIQKIVFIHGVGEGVLKMELEYLFGRYDNVKYYEADYKKYGLGATEVYIYQNKN
jgi:DNA-nicking Smr family endonuclease